MSNGTNPERISQNNELLSANNQELTELKEIANALPQVINTDDATALAADIVIDKTAYVKGEKITGTVREAKANETVGTINMNATSYGDWGNGYRTLECRFEKDTLQRENSVISVPLTNPDMTIDLVAQMGITADKIAAGNTILGVEGTSAGLDTSDADALAADILEYKTAYVNGQKVTGTMTKIMNIEGPCDTVTKGENVIYISKDNITSGYYPETNNIRLNASYDLIVDAIGLLPGQIVEGNTILGVQGTATILDTAITEIWDTTNNDIQVGASGIDLIADRGVISLSSGVKGNITTKDQILISGTGNIMIETSINGSGCLCAKLNSIEALNTYMAVEGEIVVIVDDNATYLGTYQYKTGTWSEIVSDSAYQNTLTETEYDEAVATSEEILGEDGV